MVNHGVGGPGGSGYPSFEAIRRSLRRAANKEMTTTATMGVARAGLAFSMLNTIASNFSQSPRVNQRIDTSPQLGVQGMAAGFEKP